MSSVAEEPVVAAARPQVVVGHRLAFLVVGLTVLISGSHGLRTEEGLVGPGLMPFAAGLVTTIATWPRPPTRGASGTASEAGEVNAIEDADEVDHLGRTSAQRNRAVLWVFLVILGAVLMSHVIGLLLSLSLMVVILVSVVERKPWWSGVVGGIATFLFGYGVFGVVLNVPLPTGMLGLI